MNFFAASVVAAITRASPAFGAPAPITLVDVQAEADHGRHLQDGEWSRKCDQDSDCVGRHAGAECVALKCRKEWKDCRATDKPGFDCAEGKECIQKKFKDKMNKGKNWGKCKRLPTMAEIDTEYDRHDDMYMHSKGLVNYKDGHDGAGARVDFFNSGFQDGTNLFFSYDEFTRFCVNKCSKLDTCTAVSVTDWMASEDRTLEWGVDVDTNYSCELLDTRIEVRDVKAAMMGPSPNAKHTIDDSLDETDVVFVKKQHSPHVQTYVPCKVNLLDEAILGCVQSFNPNANTFSLPFEIPGLPEWDSSTLPDGWHETCQALMGLPTDVPNTKTDFWSKVWPALTCVRQKGKDPFGCIGCLSADWLLGTSNPRNPRFPNHEQVGSRFSTAEQICSEFNVTHDDGNDSHVANPIRVTCKAECYDGAEECVPKIQQAMLCSTGSALLTNPRCDGEWRGGEINVPYECP